MQPECKLYQGQIVKNAKALCDGLMRRGVKIVSGGTDNHLMLVDLSGTDLSGKELEKRLDRAHITCNKNTIPNELLQLRQEVWSKQIWTRLQRQSHL